MPSIEGGARAPRQHVDTFWEGYGNTSRDPCSDDENDNGASDREHPWAWAPRQQFASVHHDNIGIEPDRDDNDFDNIHERDNL